MSGEAINEIKKFFGTTDGLQEFGIDFLYANGTECCNPVNTEENADNLKYEPIYQLLINKNINGAPKDDQINDDVKKFFLNLGRYHRDINPAIYKKNEDTEINSKVCNFVSKHMPMFENSNIDQLINTYYVTSNAAKNIKDIINKEPVNMRESLLCDMFRNISYLNKNQSIYSDIYTGKKANYGKGTNLNINDSKLSGFLYDFYRKNVASYSEEKRYIMDVDEESKKLYGLIDTIKTGSDKAIQSVTDSEKYLVTLINNLDAYIKDSATLKDSDDAKKLNATIGDHAEDRAIKKYDKKINNTIKNAVDAGIKFGEIITKVDEIIFQSAIDINKLDNSSTENKIKELNSIIKDIDNFIDTNIRIYGECKLVISKNSINVTTTLGNKEAFDEATKSYNLVKNMSLVVSEINKKSTKINDNLKDYINIHKKFITEQEYYNLANKSVENANKVIELYKKLLNNPDNDAKKTELTKAAQDAKQNANDAKSKNDTEEIKEIINIVETIGQLEKSGTSKHVHSTVLKKTIFDKNYIPIFVNYIPYVPGPDAKLLKSQYIEGYFSSDKTADVKIVKNTDEYFKSLLKFARSKPIDRPVSFSKADFESIPIEITTHKPPKYQYGKDNKLHLLNGDAVGDVGENDYENIMLSDKETNKKFIADCILTNDQGGLKMCIDFMNKKDIFKNAGKELSLHPELAKQILRKFGFKKIKSTSTIEPYGNWEFRMKRNFIEGKFPKTEYESLFNNTGLLEYIKGVLDFVNNSPDIMKKPEESVIINDIDAKKIGLIYERPLMRGGSKLAISNRSEIMRRGILNHLATFSPEGLLSSPVNYNRNASQTGGCLENDIIMQINLLLDTENITVAESDKNQLLDIAKDIKKKQNEIAELVNYIKKLKNIRSIYDKNDTPSRVNINSLISNRSEIDYLTEKINSNRECLNTSIDQTTGLCKDLMTRYKNFSTQLFTPYTVPFGNTNIESL